MGIANELIKMGPKKVGKKLISKAEDFIAGKISGSSWIPMKYKKLVLGRGDKPSGKELSFKDTRGEKITKRMTKDAKIKMHLVLCLLILVKYLVVQTT